VFVDKTQLEAHLQTQVAESKNLFMLLLQVMTIKTDGMKVDTSVRTFVETHDSPASVILTQGILSE